MLISLPLILSAALHPALSQKTPCQPIETMTTPYGKFFVLIFASSVDENGDFNHMEFWHVQQIRYYLDQVGHHPLFPIGIIIYDICGDEKRAIDAVIHYKEKLQETNELFGHAKKLIEDLNVKNIFTLLAALVKILGRFALGNLLKIESKDKLCCCQPQEIMSIIAVAGRLTDETAKIISVILQRSGSLAIYISLREANNREENVARETPRYFTIVGTGYVVSRFTIDLMLKFG